MRKVIGIGETLLDVVFQNGQPISAIPGGSVFNGLVSLARADIPVIFISEIGNDHIGKIIRSYMHENNIPTDYIDSFPDGKSPVSMAFLDEENNAEFLIYKDYPKERLEVAFPPIEQDDIFILSSYYALNPALRERVVELLEYAKDRKALIYYDLNFRKPHAHEAIKLVPTFIENFEFADIIRGSTEDFNNLYSKSDPDAIFQNHMRFYNKKLIITQGVENVLLYNGTERLELPTTETETISTIGAGDNFNAGVIWGLIKNDIRKDDLDKLTPEAWSAIIQNGIDFATEACQTIHNSVSEEFAKSYASHYKNN